MIKIILIPGNEGKDCPGNGSIKGIECQCDECNWLMCCIPEYNPTNCVGCDVKDCPKN